MSLLRVFFYCFRVLIMSVMMVGQTDTDERNSFVYVYVVVCVCVCVCVYEEFAHKQFP